MREANAKWVRPKINNPKAMINWPKKTLQPQPSQSSLKENGHFAALALGLFGKLGGFIRGFMKDSFPLGTRVRWAIARLALSGRRSRFRGSSARLVLETEL